MNDQVEPHDDSTTVDSPEPRSGPESPVLRLVVAVSDNESVRIFELSDGAQRTIGRSPQADIQWDDASLSRVHAELRRSGDCVLLRDLGSRNGCWVGGRRVDQAELRVGDVASLGGLTLAVQLRPSAEPALLGVLGSGSVLHALAQECARCRQLQRPLSVLMLRALRPTELSLPELVARCASVTSPLDRLGLYDRAVLLAVLPESDSAAAARKAERIAAPGGVICGIASLPEAGITPDQLVTAASCALASSSQVRPATSARTAVATRNADSGPLVRRSAAMLDLQRLIERLAPKRIPVLVLGETGTGKELVARELHERSGRRGPLKVVNCAAIPEQLVESTLFGHVKGSFTGAERDQPGVFVQAHRGTIFLDEIGELSPAAQAALLRTLDTQRVCPVGAQAEIGVDVRVVAATHRDLGAMTERGEFRLDLFHRLNAVVLQVPPLRERPEEIAPLIDAFLTQFGSAGESRPLFDRDALARLQAYAWPGNVRELRNVVERALAIRDGAEIGLRDLPAHIAYESQPGVRREPPAPTAHAAPPALNDPGAPDIEAQSLDLRSSMRAHESRLISEALRRTHGNQRRAAALLRLPLRTFERKLKLLGSRIPRSR